MPTPTGAGGFWSFFITKTSLYSDGAGLVAGLVGASPQLDFLHPVLSVLELGLAGEGAGRLDAPAPQRRP